MCNRIKKSAKQDVQDKACLFVSKSWLKSKSKKKSKNRDIYFLSISHSPISNDVLLLSVRSKIMKHVYVLFVAFRKKCKWSFKLLF